MAIVVVGPLMANGQGQAAPAAAPAAAAPAAAPAEIVNGKFVNTRNIVVEVYDRGNAGGTKPEDNIFTNFIKAGMLKDHNVAVTFKPVPRWTEVEALNNLLAAGSAPDVCVTYSYPTIQTYANQGGVTDMAPYLAKYKDMLPNLYALLGDANINWNKDPVKGTIWAIEAKLAHNPRINTFVREDWLKKLNLKAPTNTAEFEAMLKAFKDNAAVLLGKDADKMIPLGMSFDIGWVADPVLTSFVPNAVTDKELYIRGFDDRHFLYPGIKEGVRLLNKWYNDGLIWKDFPLYGAGDTTGDNLTKAGYVGAYMGNWDIPYRSGDTGVAGALHKLIGPDANYIAIDCFKNDAGIYRKFLAPPIDRKVFLPNTNKEPLASLLYLDWLSTLANRKYLQLGDAGINHEVQADGSYKALSAVAPNIMNSANNIDYTITLNGLDLGDPAITIKSVAIGYAGVDKKYIESAYAIAKNGARIVAPVNVGQIMAEEGMGPALKEKRDNLLAQAVVAKPAQFDAIWDAGMKDYLASGAQAIMDERKAKYEQFIK
jgi:putative aldouronate transport system substrate-binding protein